VLCRTLGAYFSAVVRSPSRLCEFQIPKPSEQVLVLQRDGSANSVSVHRCWGDFIPVLREVHPRSWFGKPTVKMALNRDFFLSTPSIATSAILHLHFTNHVNDVTFLVSGDQASAGRIGGNAYPRHAKKTGRWRGIGRLWFILPNPERVRKWVSQLFWCYHMDVFEGRFQISFFWRTRVILWTIPSWRFISCRRGIRHYCSTTIPADSWW